MKRTSQGPATKRGPAAGRLDPRERAQRLLNQAAEFLAEGKAGEAIPLLQRAHRLDRGNALILLNLGGAYIMTGRHREAVPLLEAARDAEPDNDMVWTNLGAAYLGNPVLATPEQQSRAIHAFEQAIQRNPASPSVHYNLGLIYVDRGEIDQARNAFTCALQVNPTDRDAKAWLARLRPAVPGEQADETNSPAQPSG